MSKVICLPKAIFLFQAIFLLVFLPKAIFLLVFLPKAIVGVELSLTFSPPRPGQETSLAQFLRPLLSWQGYYQHNHFSLFSFVQGYHQHQVELKYNYDETETDRKLPQNIPTSNH